MLLNKSVDELIEIYKEHGPICTCESNCFYVSDQYCSSQRTAAIAYKALSKAGIKFAQEVFVARLHALDTGNKEDFDYLLSITSNIKRPDNERRL